MQTGAEKLSEEEPSSPFLKIFSAVSVLLFVYQQKPLEEDVSPLTHTLSLETAQSPLSPKDNVGTERTSTRQSRSDRKALCNFFIFHNLFLIPGDRRKAGDYPEVI